MEAAHVAALDKMATTQDQRILALNCGSSSLKFGAYASSQCLYEGEAEEIKDQGIALTQALEELSTQGLREFSIVGHRVVHGGPDLRKHVLLTDDVFSKLKAATPFAPLHLPASLAVISAVRAKMPNIPQVICLDTAFHRNMPDVAREYALPEKIRHLGIQRFGFHGLSLESILEQLHPVPTNLVVAHLGNGSSITAIRNGRSIDTSMGLTPTGGVMMGTRSGDLDPGVMLFLSRHGFSKPDDLETLVNRQSGLLGVSGISNDVRTHPARRCCLLCACSLTKSAKRSLEWQPLSGGIDLLVFTGGIGEHAAAVRQAICENLEMDRLFRNSRLARPGGSADRPNCAILAK